MILSATPVAAIAEGTADTPEVRSQSSMQMSSVPEVVYVNNISDTGIRTQSFNDNWKFYLGDASGAEAQAFDDSTWEYVTLPHDYSIDQDYSPSMEAESAYKPGGVGWYRKSFYVDQALAGKQVRIDFDGVYMDATVWINGTQLGNHPYGYTPFSFDLTPYLKAGEENVITVKVNHQTPSSRWYSGSGIGRNVDLVVTGKVAVAKDGVRVTSPDLQAQSSGAVTTKLSSTVSNSGDADVAVSLSQTVFPKDGSPEQAIGSITTQPQTLAAGETKTIESQLEAANPSLWSTESPNLYTVRTEVKVDGQTVDTYDTTYGYRWFNYDANTGFSLNGQNVKIKGVCMHQDQGALGSVDSRAAVERQVRILKEMGCNSIRTSHNSPSRVLVEVCQEQGILLDEEVFDGWTAAKNGNSNDYARFFSQTIGESRILGATADETWAEFDLKQTIARDFNSPSVIMWSVGNEMTTGSSAGFDAAAQASLIRWTTEADPTRPVTLGDNQLKSGSTAYGPQNIFAAGGLTGINYADGSMYDRLHREHREWKFYGSETASAVNSRGVYNTLGSQTDAGGHQLTSYDTSAVGWGHVAAKAWFDTITRDFVAGEYVWTGFDYLGEPTPWNGTAPGTQGGDWSIAPKNSYFGIIDTAGLPKDSYYLYQSQWNDSVHTLHVLPAWESDMVKKTGNNVKVVVYTDAPEVELFFTPVGSTQAQSLGKKKFTKKATDAGYTYQVYEGADKSNTNHENLYLSWSVPYADGTIWAKAYDENGQELSTADWDGRQSVTTTSAATQLEATVDRAQVSANGDLAYVTVGVKDKDGNVVPDAQNNVKFEVTGAGELAGVDNGSSPDHQSYRDDNRNAWAGQLVGIVRATGSGGITVKVTSDGLQSASVTTSSVGTGDAPAEKTVSSLRYSRYHYVKTGTSLALPEQIEVRYTDGTAENKAVTWDNVSNEVLSAPGTFQVAGEVDGIRVSCTVTVLDEVAALLNYSTTTPVGTPAILPESRPAAMADGSVLNASFPVKWAEPAASAYDAAGTVTIEGTANVFGKDTAVTATVRVQSETLTIGDNVANSGALMSLSQSVPEGKQSDTLSAVNDGVTTHAPGDGSANPSCWSNYAYAQEGNTTSSITFNYNTQQRLGRAVIYFVDDSWSACFPDAGTTKVEVSEDGKDWRPVATQETIGAQSGRVKPYAYDFDPTLATFVRFTFTNVDKTLGSKAKPCTCVTEIQLFEAKGSFTTNTAAELESLSVNGKQVSSAALASGSYSTRALSATVDARPLDNAAITVLPAFQNRVNIILESEDHATRSVFTINLAAPAEDAGLAPEDDSHDYPVENITPTTGSAHAGSGNEGPVELAFDGEPGTHYHSEWSPLASFDQLWIAMELAEPATVEAVRYLPRQANGKNGTVTGYLVQASDDGQTWENVGSGTWESPVDAGYTGGWQIATLDQPTTAKHFRLKAVHTYGDSGNDKFMSASEIRLRTAAQTTDISKVENGITVEIPASVTVEHVDAEHPVTPTDLSVKVTGEQGELTYGIDYLVSIANAAQPGKTTVTVEGIGDYSGTVEGTTTINVAAPTLQGIAVKSGPTKSIYKVGEKLDPSGLVLELSWSDGTTTEVAYGADNASAFSFDPSLDAGLAEAASLEVTVTYQGREGTFDVRVEDAAPVDPVDPVDPADPVDPGDPSDPSSPTDPAGPGDPASPEDSGSTTPDAGNQDVSGSPAASGDKPVPNKPQASQIPNAGDPASLAGLLGALGTFGVAAGAVAWRRRR